MVVLGAGGTGSKRQQHLDNPVVDEDTFPVGCECESETFKLDFSVQRRLVIITCSQCGEWIADVHYEPTVEKVQ